MQIGGIQPAAAASWNSFIAQAASAKEVIPQAAAALTRNFDTMDFSDRVKDAAGSATEQAAEKTSGAGALEKTQQSECQTCANRAYQDGSDDPTVSFQSAQKVDPKTAVATVLSHEMEHVRNEKEKAKEEGREVISQTVTLKYGLCPECGKLYVAGGETQTMTKAVPQEENQAKGQTVNQV